LGAVQLQAGFAEEVLSFRCKSSNIGQNEQR
jgi:hypothetical protein